MSTNHIREQVKGWRFFLTRKVVLGLCGDLDAANQQAEVCRQALAQAQAKLELLQHDHDRAKKGNSVLLGFLREAHRLDVPTEPGSARELLNKP